MIPYLFGIIKTDVHEKRNKNYYFFVYILK
jgi:hypothetical protein